MLFEHHSKKVDIAAPTRDTDGDMEGRSPPIPRGPPPPQNKLPGLSLPDSNPDLLSSPSQPRSTGPSPLPTPMDAVPSDPPSDLEDMKDSQDSWSAAALYLARLGGKDGQVVAKDPDNNGELAQKYKETRKKMQVLKKGLLQFKKENETLMAENDDLNKALAKAKLDFETDSFAFAEEKKELIRKFNRSAETNQARMEELRLENEKLKREIEASKQGMTLINQDRAMLYHEIEKLKEQLDTAHGQRNPRAASETAQSNESKSTDDADITPTSSSRLAPFLEEVYENQRHLPLIGWREPSLPTDRHAFTDETGKIPRKFESVELPVGWRWVGNWKIDFSLPECGEDGWEYSRDFSSFLGGWHAKKSILDMVRRRRWVRARERTEKYANQDSRNFSQEPGTANSTGNL